MSAPVPLPPNLQSRETLVKDLRATMSMLNGTKIKGIVAVHLAVETQEEKFLDKNLVEAWQKFNSLLWIASVQEDLIEGIDKEAAEKKSG